MSGSSAPAGQKQVAIPSPPQDWTFDTALAWLNAKVNFERQPNRDLAARVLKLDRVHALSAALGNPHRATPCIHVAGSKGKGSITRMAASILTAAGVRTGAFTSPHLIAPNERIAVDRNPISDGDLALALWRVAQAEASLPSAILAEYGTPTYFEAITVAAFDHFARSQCRAAVYEVGLGGRLDSTNIVHPAACVLASIELEHAEILGHTLEAIAHEKAGILKPGSRAITLPQTPGVLAVFRETAKATGATLEVLGRDMPFEHAMQDGHAIVRVAVDGRVYENLRCPMPGAHQAANTAAAVAACAILLGERLTDEALHAGLAATPRDGRMETIASSPITIIDGAHTPASVRAALDALQAHEGPLVVLFGCAKDKDMAGMFVHLAASGARIVFTQAGPRSRQAAEMQQTYPGPSEAETDPAQALARARTLAGPDGLVLVLGSFMLAGAVKGLN